MLDDIIPRRGTKVARFYDQMEAHGALRNDGVASVAFSFVRRK